MTGLFFINAFDIAFLTDKELIANGEPPKYGYAGMADLARSAEEALKNAKVELETTFSKEKGFKTEYV